MRKMRKIKHILCLALLLGALLLASSGCGAVPLAKADELTDVGNRQREVQLLNLLNGLELSADQMRFLLEKAQEAQEVREEFKDKADGNVAETTEVLSELRATLMKGENIPDSLREQWYSTHSKNLELRGEYEEEMARIAREV